MINKYHILIKSTHEEGKIIVGLEEKSHDDYHGEHGAREYYRCEDVDEIIKVMLDALIEGVKTYEENFNDSYYVEFIQKQIKAIEKATGKTWEELSE